MKLLLIALVTFIGCAAAKVTASKWTEKEVQEILTRVTTSPRSTAPELIIANGYTAEIYHVTTEDGYILEMHRIPASPTSPAAAGKPVAFVMHGLLSSSADWIIMGPGKALGYILADAGYDVWMGNARGNTYSKNHTTITDFKGEDFWHFSWHEIGVYDLPAMIDFALKTTGQKKVVYIGHSQGTTSFYVMASMKPQYNAKIKVMFSLAPVAYMGNLFSPVIRWASLATTPLATLLRLFGVHEFLPKSELIATAGALFCNDDAISQALCANALFLVCGFDKAQLNQTMLPAILQHTPAGSSTRQLIHYSQEVASGKFRQYDHGVFENVAAYKSVKPPEYNLQKITAPIYLVYSKNDWLSATTDVAQLFGELKNSRGMNLVSYNKWNHLDYLYGTNAKELVYDPMLATIKAYFIDNE